MHLSDIVRYDRERGAVLVSRWRPGEPRELALADAADVASALAQGGAADGDEALRLAVLGLALAARAGRGWPTDALRGALIQAGERLRAAWAPAWDAAALSDGLAQADQAVVAGEDAEAALLALADRMAQASDRAAERCGRHTADLLDDGDRVLLLPLGGRPLAWAVRAAVQHGRSVQLAVPAGMAESEGARRLADWALAGGELQPLDDWSGASICLVEAVSVAPGGEVALQPGGREAVARARQHMPVYALAPGGPRGEALPAGDETAAPAEISAIVTSRGIYRPEMVWRHHSDSDAPLDVIPLLP